MPRSTKWNKTRKFTGNMYIKLNRPNQNIARPNIDVPETTSQEPRPTSAQSASKRKLSENMTMYDEFTVKTSNIIISFDILSSVLNEFVSCKACGGKIQLGEERKQRNGLASLLVLDCLDCEFKTEFWSSDKCKARPGREKQLFEINSRLFYGLRSIGKGAEAGKMLCGMLNLPAPSTAVSKYTGVLREALQNVAEESMQRATSEAVEANVVEENDLATDIAIAFDGTWQKRGFISKNACCTVTSVDTGKVLDVEVLTKYCSGCEKSKLDVNKKAKHEPNCQKNYEGSSGGMEVQAAVAVCRRSLASRGVRYVKFLGDGDSKSFGAVAADKPYGQKQVEKLECVGHVQKRMGHRLRSLVSSNKGQLLSDGKPLQRRLTGKIMDLLQNYYHRAILGNTDSLSNMRKAVWAIFYHKRSTDEEPLHAFCPPPPTTWCKYNLAQAENKPYTHKNSIPVPVMEAMKPTFKALSDPSLLRKCLHGKTQNVNESFNNIIWSRIPKNNFVGRKTLELGVYDSIITFNDGNIGRIKLLKELGFTDYGVNTINALKSADEERVRKADRAAMDATKEARVARRRKRIVEDEGGEDFYSPGAF